MKTLVVVTHPDIANSVVNKRWLEELRRYPERYTVHELHQAYPDWQIDVAQEQRLIEAHDNIVLQFPIFWFSSPPLLKKWLDDVLTYGWAYGSRSGYKMQNKKLALAVTAGVRAEDYARDGRDGGAAAIPRIGSQRARLPGISRRPELTPRLGCARARASCYSM
ncbi:General stress protein 14 [Serratia marcescens]|nr:General stress protein 14 [Serratia marcescens]